ncbi:HAD domain-containing protein [Pseudomonas sp. Leaf127]|uniref:HAD domain-containing protein n=1 Tax=Pseudomonas sp. Leaf127 TaxID=1736267 RepID=UPI000A57519F|nr:HAD domain-containing protein [Pseudomonas sp. Leaf127]
MSIVLHTQEKFMMAARNAHVIFLDYDGVLHPDAVYLSKQGPSLKADGELFMWAPALVQLLEEFPSVSLVLSTSWVRHLGFKKALGYLPQSMRNKVIGATWHSSMSREWPDEQTWDGRTRYTQICRYASRAHLQHWLAIDDDASGWPPEAGKYLIHCVADQGLGHESTLSSLRRGLEELVAQ